MKHDPALARTWATLGRPGVGSFLGPPPNRSQQQVDVPLGGTWRGDWWGIDPSPGWCLHPESSVLMWAFHKADVGSPGEAPRSTSLKDISAHIQITPRPGYPPPGRIVGRGSHLTLRAKT